MFIDNLRVRIEKLESVVFGSDSVTSDTVTVKITSPNTATNGTLTSDNMNALQNATAVIEFDGNVYRLYDDKEDIGYKVYAYVHDGCMDKITVNIATYAWVLVRG